jgi:predicted enzyme related to lactoylglutathione lyase
MTERVATLGSVVINVLDYERQKAFWSAVLGVEVAREFPGFFCWLAPQDGGGVSLALQKVEEATEGRRRLHLDTGVDDLDAAQARIEELGGSLVETHTFPGFEWRVMHDPEGNEFCIAHQTEMA